MIKKEKFLGLYAFYKLIIAYFAILIVNMLINSSVFTESLFFINTSLLSVIFGVFLLWILLCTLCKDRWCVPVMISLLTVYCYLVIKQRHEELFLMGCIAVLFLFIAMLKWESDSLKLSDKVLWGCIIVLGLSIVALVSSICIIMYRDNYQSCYDFGLFAQMYHYMRKTGLPLTTCERDGLLSHFAVHISPVYYLILPVFALLPRPETLMAMQCVVTFSGIIPLCLLCKKRHLSNPAILGFTVCFLLYPSFTGGCYYCFHENNFLPPLLLWLVYAFEVWRETVSDHSSGKKARVLRTIGVFLAAVLVLGIKEDAAIYVACVALYFFAKDIRACLEDLTWKQILSSRALWIFLLSVAYFITAVLFLSTKGDGAMTGRYNTYIYDDSGSLFVMLLGIFKNPAYVVAQCMSEEKLLLIAYMLLPLALLPILSGKIENWILMIPFMLLNVMPNYSYQNSIMYQYAFGSGVLLIYLALVNYTENVKRKKILTTAVAACILIYCFHFGGRLKTNLDSYKNNAGYRETVAKAADLIPDDVQLAADTFLIPMFSQRDELYQLETTEVICEYYALDLRHVDVDEKYLDPDVYEELYRQDGAIAVYRRKDWKKGMKSAKAEFADAAKHLQTGIDKEIREFLADHSLDELEELGDLQIEELTVKRVMTDQHWTTVSESGSPEAVYIVDADGTLVYISFRDADYVVTWSGPTEDKEFAEREGGWSSGRGAGWTGSIPVK